jgi:hypothetical protein
MTWGNLWWVFRTAILLGDKPVKKQPMSWGMLLTVFLLGGACAVAFLHRDRNLASPGRAAAAEATDGDLDVRYAQACLNLAQMDLASAEEENKKLPGVIPPRVLQPLRQIVAIAEIQLQLAQQGGRVSFREARIRSAQAALQAAESSLQLATAHSPPAKDDANVERLRTAVAVARLDVARARTAKEQPTIADLQGQLYDLQKEVLYLRSKLAELWGR